MSGEEEAYVEDFIDIAKDPAVKPRPVEELIQSPVELDVPKSQPAVRSADDITVEQLAAPPGNVMMSPFTAYFSRQMPRSPALNDSGLSPSLKPDFDPFFLDQCIDILFEKNLC